MVTAPIRVATLGDLPAIVSIYNEAVAAPFACGDTSPVSVESWRAWFAQHEPARYPVHVWEDAGEIKGWCSLSVYRPGRQALRFTAEISYFVRQDSHRRGIASALIEEMLDGCAALRIKNVFAIVLERNARSIALLNKLGFVEWGRLPKVADFNGVECGQIYYGRRLAWAAEAGLEN
jgi:L-amino acid N-acyltransferase YncA